MTLTIEWLPFWVTPKDSRGWASKYLTNLVRSVIFPIFTHYNDVIMGAIASQITSLMTVYSTFYSGVDQRKQQSSASLAFVRGIHRWTVNSPHKWPVMRINFPFDDVIMHYQTTVNYWMPISYLTGVIVAISRNLTFFCKIQPFLNSSYGTNSAPSHYLNQCWNIDNWNLMNKTQWNLNRKFIHFHARKCICKYRLRNGGHFVQDETS